MANSAPKNQPSKEIAPTRALDDMTPDIVTASLFDDAALRNIASFEDAIRLATQAHGDIVSAGDVLGDGFTLVKDKQALEGLPLILMEWTFREGDFDTPYVSVRAVAKLQNGQLWKVVFNDGSTGIAEQLAKQTKESGRLGGMVVPNGLRLSEYPTDIDTGKPLNKAEQEEYAAAGKKTGRGQTWYLDTSN